MVSIRLWVLGGNDGEMEAIKELLDVALERYVQPQMNWGDHRYSAKDLGLVARSDLHKSIVFVECRPAGYFQNVDLHVIDHHGDRSSEPPSVSQVLGMLESLGLRINEAKRRWLELVGANDCGAYSSMESIGATPEEMRRVRAYTRKAQGITAEHEATARIALDLAQMCGRVLVVQLPNVSVKNVCVIDQLYEDGRKGQEYMIVGPGNFHLSGDGEVCARLKEKFGGWTGGVGLGKKGDKWNQHLTNIYTQTGFS